MPELGLSIGKMCKAMVIWQCIGAGYRAGKKSIGPDSTPDLLNPNLQEWGLGICSLKKVPELTLVQHLGEKPLALSIGLQIIFHGFVSFWKVG